MFKTYDIDSKTNFYVRGINTSIYVMNSKECTVEYIGSSPVHLNNDDVHVIDGTSIITIEPKSNELCCVFPFYSSLYEYQVTKDIVDISGSNHYYYDTKDKRGSVSVLFINPYIRNISTYFNSSNYQLLTYREFDFGANKEYNNICCRFFIINKYDNWSYSNSFSITLGSSAEIISRNYYEEFQIHQKFDVIDDFSIKLSSSDLIINLQSLKSFEIDVLVNSDLRYTINEKNPMFMTGTIKDTIKPELVIRKTEMNRMSIL